jgi:hydrogenase maturation protease
VAAKRILIFGAGNLLLSDEGFGVHFVRQLQAQYLFPPEVELLDAGTLGMMLMHKLEAAERVYIVDTIADQGASGECRRLNKDQFLHGGLALKLSPHQAGVQEMLLVSELRGRCPAEVILLGVIPACLEPGTELSAPLRECLDKVASDLVKELRDLGYKIDLI